MWHSGWLLLSTVVEVGQTQQDLHSQPVSISDSIERSKSFEVSIEDTFGEGEGCFDSDPNITPRL